MKSYHYTNSFLSLMCLYINVLILRYVKLHQGNFNFNLKMVLFHRDASSNINPADNLLGTNKHLPG